ncbi:hypothetical protein P3X46_004579 [Hevea brasiliensis]|uniref:DUF4283 domain-containing protein n=1 Tax=Hevea brasiliensis TaxID=3981 RepID=A0ABQ9MX91_HEVBR|nr:hypothetical protein P3X46_004579 [Hevea brasiliensis]
MAHFSNQNEYEGVLFDGPWMVAGHYLTVRQWHPNFDPDLAQIEKAMLWVRVPNLPIEYYSHTFLWVGQRIGVPIHIDDTTLSVSRGKFARMCVEVDLSKTLLSKFKFQRRIRKIEYEGINLICFECGVYGHRRKDHPSCVPHGDAPVCGGSLEQNHENTATECAPSVPEVVIQPEVIDKFGPWMIAKRTSRRSSRKAVTKEDIAPKSKGVEKGHYMSKSGTGDQKATGSRFSALYNTLVAKMVKRIKRN